MPPKIVKEKKEKKEKSNESEIKIKVKSSKKKIPENIQINMVLSLLILLFHLKW